MLGFVVFLCGFCDMDTLSPPTIDPRVRIGMYRFKAELAIGEGHSPEISLGANVKYNPWKQYPGAKIEIKYEPTTRDSIVVEVRRLQQPK